MAKKENFQQYHLHKDDYSKLHFELYDAAPYVQKYLAQSTVPHRHTFYQLIWFKSAGSHYIDYQMIEHEENSVFFINKRQVHHFHAEAPNEGYLFHFNDIFIDRFNGELMRRFNYSIFDELSKPFVSLFDKDIAKLSSIVSLLQDELATKDHFYEAHVFSYLQTFLFQIERLKKQQGANLDSHPDHRIAYAFRDLIYEHMNTFLSIAEFASLLNISSKKLTTICKQYLQDTPANIIKEVKILEAKRMLTNRNMTIQEVVYAVGFDQPTYFTKYFKKSTGMTPKEFRASF